MTTTAQTLHYARELFSLYESYRLQAIATSRFTQQDMLGWLQQFDGTGIYTRTQAGVSGEGRPISLYTLGNGTVKVLLWSQMHGDEPTATMALMDIFRFFANHPEHALVQAIRTHLTMLVIPMLNPDGAERFTRRTAHAIDMNRDALALATPEARILKQARDTYQPEYGFNLHDQDTRLTVGTTKKITAVALLAPAMDESRRDTAVRTRAKKVASTIADILQLFIPGHLAKWDDTFEPRAFGDNVQKWGTSTVLIESGGWKNDPDKFFIRKLNFVALLSSLYAIASKETEQANIDVYEQLPFNTKYGCDVIIRRGSWKRNERTNVCTIDVAINIDKKLNAGTRQWEDVATIVDIGDLSTWTALQREIDADGKTLDPDLVTLDRTFPAGEITRLLREP